MATTLDELHAYLDKPHRYSEYISALCPFHADSTPSLLISESGFRCQACGKSGNLDYLYSVIAGHGFKKPQIQYRVWTDFIRRFHSVEETVEFARRNLQKSPEQGHYLRQRKVGDFIYEGRLGYIDGYYTFPVFDSGGEIQACVLRASPTLKAESRYITSYEPKQKIYVPRYDFDNFDTVYIVFGIIDSIAMTLAGFQTITGITGKSFPYDEVRHIRKPMMIIPDEHEHREAAQLALNLGWRGKVKRLNYCECCKDPADILKNHGIVELQNKVKENIT